MERIIQIDSTYVNKNIYPYDTDFIIPINGTPPVNNDVNDIRCISYTQEQVLDRFIWIGNNTINIFNNINNNAVSFNFYVLDNYNIIGDFSTTTPPINVPFVSFELYLQNIVKRNNYFVGCFFYFEGYTTQITQYNGTTNKFTFLNSFPFSLTNYTSGIYTGYIINPTLTTPNNLIVLLESSFMFTQTLQELLGVKTINRSQTIWHVRTGNQFIVQDFTPVSRDVLLEPEISDYQSNDLFLLRPTRTTLLGYVQGVGQKFWYQGIYDFEITNSGNGYSIGDTVKIIGNTKNATFKIIDVNQGSITNMQIIDPGNGFDNNIYTLVPLISTGTGGSIRILRSSPYFVATNNIDNTKKFLAFFPDFQIHLTIQYFVILRVIENIIYFYTNQDTLDNLNNPDFYYNFNDGASIVDFIPYNNYYPSINLQLIPYQQTVCYRIKIASIALPNLPVCGYNILLANFPYVLVTLMNGTSGSGGENYGMMISNNPYAIRSTFICPIANIRNPDYVRFVVVNSNQSMIIKFSPNDALRFTVNLPNGELLKFQNNEGICEKSVPITNNFIEGSNVNTVYTFRYRKSLVSVTFTFELVK